MTKAEDWTGISEDAQLYENNFVPTLFGPWAPRVADAAGINSDDRVLDVGCGTGVLTREAAQRVGASGHVTGLDLNEGMLSVARLVGPEIEWRQGDAGDLPFADESFDVVVSQFALMYFPDRSAALREMWRVLVSGGRLAVAVWAPHERAKGYVELARIARRYAGEKAVDIIRKPHMLGEPETLRTLFDEAGIEDPETKILDGVYTQPSIDYFLESEVKGSPLFNLFDDENYQPFLEETREVLKSFLLPNGELVIPMDATIVTAQKES
jgi:ubiquinone/menaquinone biosynthesis C-methylase UbiE